MATNSGGTNNPGSDGSDAGSGGSQGNDPAQPGSSNRFAAMPEEVIFHILDRMDALPLLGLAQTDRAHNSRTMKYMEEKKEFRIRIDSTILDPNAIGQRGTVVDFVRLQPDEKFNEEKRPAANDKTWNNVNLVHAIRRMPPAWVKYATDVAIWFSDDCNDGNTKWILDELHARLFGAPEEAGSSAKAEPKGSKAVTSIRSVVKLHLINTSHADANKPERNILRPIFTAKSPSLRTIAQLHPRLKLTTLQLHHEFQRSTPYIAQTRIFLFEYFRGTEANTKLILRNVGGGDINQLAFIHRAFNETERFPNLTAMELHREPGGIPGQPNWAILPRFSQLADLSIVGSSAREFSMQLPAQATVMDGLQSLRLSNAHLPDAGFIRSLPELRTLVVERIQGSANLDTDDLVEVCGAMRNNRLPKLHDATFRFDFLNNEFLDSIHLRHLLKTAGENQCPNLKRLMWRGQDATVLQGDGNFRRIFETGLTAGALDNTNFVLVILTIQRAFPSIDSGRFRDEIIKLAAAVQHCGLKQLKFCVQIFGGNQPNWEEIKEFINRDNGEFSAKIRSTDDAVEQGPLPLLHIDCDNRMQLLISKRAAPVHAAESPEAAEANDAASHE